MRVKLLRQSLHLSEVRKMKKKGLLIGVLAVLLLVGCNSDDSSGGKAAGDEVKIRFAHSAVEDNPRHEGALKFKELVEGKSDGKISVEVFANEVLGSEPQMVENVSMNDLEMVASSTFAQYEPKVDLFGLPFLFDDNEAAWESLDSEVSKDIYSSLLDNNLRVIGHFENGMRHTTTKDKPIESIEDFKGLKIRTPEMKILMDIFKSLGASPTPMAFGELYMALQQGTVDGQENPITNINASKFYEVQKYLSLTGHSYSSTDIAISNQFWTSLSDEQQQIIQESIDEAVKFQRNLVVEKEADYLEELKSHGMIVNEPDKAGLRDATNSVYEDYRKKMGDELIDKLLEFNN